MMKPPVKVSGKYWKLKECYPDGETIEEMTDHPTLNKGGVIITKKVYPSENPEYTSIELSWGIWQNGRYMLHRPNGKKAIIKVWPHGKSKQEFWVYCVNGGGHKDVGPSEVERHGSGARSLQFYINGEPAMGPHGATALDFDRHGVLTSFHRYNPVKGEYEFPCYPRRDEGIALKEAMEFKATPFPQGPK